LPVSAADVIAFAFRHAKEQLLQPFRFGQWARLALVGFLAGEITSFGGCNFNYPLVRDHRTSQQFLDSGLSAQWTGHPVLFVALIAALVVAGTGLLVLFIYINSVMRFILFDSIVARECHIRQGWSRRKHIGYRFFLWQLSFMLATLAAILIVIGIPAACAAALGWLTHARDHVLGLVLSGVALLLVLLVLVVFLGVVSVMTKDFVVPQMALENIAVMEAWRRLWLWIKHEKGGYAGYIAIKIALAMAATLAVVIVTVIVLLAFVVVIGGFGLVAVLGGKALGWTWNPYTISAAVVLGCIALAGFVFVTALISVPTVAFFPAYSIYFLAARYSQLASLLSPGPSAPVPPGQPPPLLEPS
jgi:hypothetical protein